MDKAKIIERIQQLKALATNNPSKNEKEAAVAAIARLMAKYQVSDAETEVKTGTKLDEMFTDQHSDWNVVYESGRATPWKSTLFFGLAELNGLYGLKYGVRGSTSHKRASRFRVFGRKGDIEICKYMFTLLEHEISELGKDYVGFGEKRGVNPERESWCLGCVLGFLKKMKAEKEEVIKTSTAMVLVSNREEDAKNALFDSDPKLTVKKGGRSKLSLDGNAFSSGYTRGQLISVNKGLKE